MSRTKALAIEVIAPVLTFIAVYVAGTIAFAAVLMPLAGDDRMLVLAWASFAGAGLANLACVALFDRFRLHLGLVEAPSILLSGFLKGSLVAVGLLVTANSLILVTTDFRHQPGSGFDWLQILGVFVPAAIHEELVYRGYLLQKTAKLNLIAAVGVTSILFALVHGGNPSVGRLALVNIFLAGILLAMAWVWRRNLWIPIGIHVSWNIFIGPVLGHEVSGLVLPKTFMKTVDPGPALLTGGTFGIEASVFLTLAELGAIAFIAWRIRARGPWPASVSALPETVMLAAESDRARVVAPTDDIAPPPSNEMES